MEFDFSKLTGRIIEKFGTRERFAEAMGCTKGWISNRLNNIVHWDAEEILRACKLLDIRPDELHLYFFVPKVPLLEQS